MEDSQYDIKKRVIMRLECKSEDEKDDWVKAINVEVKQLRAEAKRLLLGNNNFWFDNLV